jgi:DNA (cytosine-5)-methyltransferase 1
VLDAQNFGVAQRRRRVFVVGYLGDWRPAAEVLFERESVRGNPAPSREKGQEVAGTFTARARSGGWGHDVNLAAGGYMQPVAKCIITKTRHDAETETLIPTYAIQGSMIGRSDNAGPQGDGINEEVCFTQNTTDRHAVAQPIPFGVAEKPNVGHCLRSGASKADKHESTTYVAQPTAFRETTDCLTAAYGTKWNGNASATNESLFARHFMAVRRLTPVECERLQGFPDNYTNIPWRKAAESPDGPRYKALGNSMAVPVMAWIGKRIADYEQ